MQNVRALRPAPLAAVPVPSTTEYDGEIQYTTDQDGARFQVPKSNPAAAIAALAVPASTVAYVNAGKTNQMLAISGGVVSLITQTRNAVVADLFVLAAAAAVDGLVAILAPGDSIAFTYTTVPVVSVIPL